MLLAKYHRRWTLPLLLLGMLIWVLFSTSPNIFKTALRTYRSFSRLVRISQISSSYWSSRQSSKIKVVSLGTSLEQMHTESQLYWKANGQQKLTSGMKILSPTFTTENGKTQGCSSPEGDSKKNVLQLTSFWNSSFFHLLQWLVSQVHNKVSLWECIAML